MTKTYRTRILEIAGLRTEGQKIEVDIDTVDGWKAVTSLEKAGFEIPEPPMGDSVRFAIKPNEKKKAIAWLKKNGYKQDMENLYPQLFEGTVAKDIDDAIGHLD